MVNYNNVLNAIKTRESVDVVYLFFLQIANYLIPLLTTPYLMAVLGAAGYGVVGFSFSVIQYFLLIVDFGFNMSSAKRIAAANKDAWNKIFTSVIIAKSILLILSLLVMLIVLCIGKLSDYRTAILCFAPLLIANTYTFFWLFQGIGNVRMISIINTLSKVLVLPLTFVLVKDKDDVYMAILLQSFVYVAASIVSNYYLLRHRVVAFEKVSINDIKEEFHESFPLFLSTASTSVYTQLFTVILGFTSTKEVVGCYSAAERIMRVLCFMLYTPISQAFFPKIAQLSSEDKIKAKRMLKYILSATFAIMLLLAIVLFFGSDIIVKYLGKDDYSLLPMILKIMSIVPIAIGCGAVLGQMGLVALGNYKTKLAFRNTYLCLAPISLIVVLLLSNLFGLYGITFSLVIAEYGVAAMMLYHYLRFNKKH